MRTPWGTRGEVGDGGLDGFPQQRGKAIGSVTRPRWIRCRRGDPKEGVEVVIAKHHGVVRVVTVAESVEVEPLAGLGLLTFAGCKKNGVAWF